MKKIFFMVVLVFAVMFNVNALEKNEVTLNFAGGIIHDGYVEYDKVANVQLFKGDELVTNITNNMVIDLNEAEYKFVIEEIEDASVSGANKSIFLNINNLYYPMTTIVGEAKSTFKLESSKFSGTLDVKLVRTRTVVNTTVKNVYNDISSKGVIDLTGGQEYVIDFSKDDELTNGLKSFADLDKTLYYKRDNEGLLATDNESEAVIKIVGNKSENKAILTAVNVGTKKSEIFKGFHMQYTGSALDYNSTNDGIIYETRFDYYTRCTYEFRFKYAEDVQERREYQVIEGTNQEYTINKDNELTFKVDADYNLFAKVYIDENLVDESNYKVTEGSTIITLNKEYVNTLNNGKHTLKVEFNDGEANTEFSILKEEIKNPSVNEEEVKNPSTSDNIEKYIILGIVALVGVIGCTLILKRNLEK